MTDEDERRFYIGDEVRLRKGHSISEMRPELLTAVGLVGDVADRRNGQTITVLYRGLGFYAANLPACTFELIDRHAKVSSAILPGRWPKHSNTGD